MKKQKTHLVAAAAFDVYLVVGRFQIQSLIQILAGVSSLVIIWQVPAVLPQYLLFTVIYRKMSTFAPIQNASPGSANEIPPSAEAEQMQDDMAERQDCVY